MNTKSHALTSLGLVLGLSTAKEGLRTSTGGAPDLDQPTMRRFQIFTSCTRSGLIIGLTCAALSAAVCAQGVTSSPLMHADAPVGSSTAQSGAPAFSGITAGQMANLEERISLVNALVNRFEPEAVALGRAEGWRQVTLESLLSLPLAALRSLESTRSVDALSSRIATAKVQLKTLGQTTQDLTYKPITPCRFIDTRNVGGKISGTRGYDLATNGGTYGGSATCDPTVLFGVNENAFGGIAMNVTIVDPSGAPGFAAVKPTAAAPVVSLINWYQSGPSVQTANQAIVTMDQGSSGSEFVVQTSSAVHVIVDFFGAFIAPEATALQCLQPSSLENSYTIGTGISNFLYSKSCPTGYTIVSGACYADTNPVYILANGTSSNQLEWFCRVNNLTAANATLNVWARCCRVPGR